MIIMTIMTIIKRVSHVLVDTKNPWKFVKLTTENMKGNGMIKERIHA